MVGDEHEFGQWKPSIWTNITPVNFKNSLHYTNPYQLVWYSSNLSFLTAEIENLLISVPYFLQLPHTESEETKPLFINFHSSTKLVLYKTKYFFGAVHARTQRPFEDCDIEVVHYRNEQTLSLIFNPYVVHFTSIKGISSFRSLELVVVMDKSQFCSRICVHLDQSFECLCWLSMYFNVTFRSSKG